MLDGCGFSAQILSDHDRGYHPAKMRRLTRFSRALPRSQWVTARVWFCKGLLVRACNTVKTGRENCRTVSDGLQKNNWILDISEVLQPAGYMQCIQLWVAISKVQRKIEVPDKFTWICSSSGEYMARSTYRYLCLGHTDFAAAKCIWRPSAPLKCKFLSGWCSKTGCGLQNEDKGMDWMIRLRPVSA